MGVSQTETLIGCNQQTWGSNMLLKTRKRGYFTNKNINNNYTKHTSCMMQLGTLILFCSPCILKNIWMNIYKYRLLYMAYAVYIYITWVKYHNISLIWDNVVLEKLPFLTIIPVTSQWGHYKDHPDIWWRKVVKLMEITFWGGNVN